MLTGSNGVIGSVIYKILTDYGINVVRVGRESSDVYFDLNDHDPRVEFRSVGALIHCAWDFSCKGSEIFTTNGFGSARLFQLARDNQIPILFISTLAAHSESESRYGSTKYFLERLVLEFGGCVARIGAYTSSHNSGLYSRLSFSAKIMPISLLPGKKTHRYYETTEHDLHNLILAYLQSKFLLRGSYFIASEYPKSLHEILRLETTHIYLGIKAPLVILRILEVLTGLNLKSDNLKSLNRQVSGKEKEALNRL